MPPGFGYPREAELWLRARHDVPEIPIAPGMDPRQVRDARYLAVVGRLRAEVALDGAHAKVCIVLASHELSRARGGPHCLSHPLVRDEVS